MKTERHNRKKKTERENTNEVAKREKAGPKKYQDNERKQLQKEIMNKKKEQNDITKEINK